jgi:hypothetical protein
MATALDKVIVTNRKVLTTKYGKAGLGKIQLALDDLIAADESRGLKTGVIDLSSAADMKKVKGKAVPGVTDLKAHKQAVDAIFTMLRPDYLLILGSIDVVPHLRLKNLTKDEDGPEIDSDLPYACDAPHDVNPRKFLAVTRVVGRLPDVVGADKPAYLVEVLRAATRYKGFPAAAYANGCFAVSTKTWKKSTEESVDNLFGSKAVETSPKSGPAWTKTQLKPQIHFINCHGALDDFQFYGEPNGFPVALDSARLSKKGNVTAGTVTAAECCYGAQQFDPSATDGELGIGNAYLQAGAYGFFGSTTIAYGPEVGNDCADIITQDFLRHVQKGASLGRAALQARQDYVMKKAVMDPIDLKTLSQFFLLGDPSITPVAATPAAATPKSKKLAAAVVDKSGGAARALRRDALVKNGAAIGEACNYVEESPRPKANVRGLTAAKSAASPALQSALKSALSGTKIEQSETFQVSGGAVPLPKSMFGAAGVARPGLGLRKSRSADRVHFALGSKTVKMGKKECKLYVAAIAREVNGKIADVKTVVRR